MLESCLVYCGLVVTYLTWLLPVDAVGDVEEDFEDLYDALRVLQRNRRSCRIQLTHILILPPNLQAVLQRSCEDGCTTLLEEENIEREDRMLAGSL